MSVEMIVAMQWCLYGFCQVGFILLAMHLIASLEPTTQE